MMKGIRMAVVYRKYEVLIKDTHRGLLYQDGKFVRVLEAGRYEVLPPRRTSFLSLLPPRPQTEIVLVDMRERDLTIKGQEILTADKVALRVSIVVQFRVTNALDAIHQVSNYEDRLYSDVQLAARRSLASMTLEQILTNRNQLNEDILRDVKGAAAGYGVDILRADVKDIIFPGNLQEIMNRVLAAERMSEAQLVEARTKAEVQQIEAQAKAGTRRMETEALVETQRRAAESEADVQRIKTEAEIRALREREQAARAYTEHPALLRLTELETLRDLSRSANARIYVNFGGVGGASEDSKDGRDEA
jgi:regulator of protease activity HflC (stomatin/prohibitin superfamily)